MWNDYLKYSTDLRRVVASCRGEEAPPLLLLSPHLWHLAAARCTQTVLARKINQYYLMGRTKPHYQTHNIENKKALTH